LGLREAKQQAKIGPLLNIQSEKEDDQLPQLWKVLAACGSTEGLWR
jgi:hypothetical protein